MSLDDFRQGVMEAMSGPAFFVAIALSGVGGLARDVGHPLGAAVVSTLLIWAGPAQIIFYGMLATKATPVAIAAAVTLSSMRFLPMCVSLLPLLRTAKTSIWTQVLASHFVSVTVWAECMRRVPQLPRDMRMAFFMGYGTACCLTSAAFTAGGYFLFSALPPLFAAGLLFVAPLYFLLAVMRNARSIADAAALVAGAALTVPVSFLTGGGADLLIVGVLGGTLAYLVHRKFRR